MAIRSLFTHLHQVRHTPLFHCGICSSPSNFLAIFDSICSIGAVSRGKILRGISSNSLPASLSRDSSPAKDSGHEADLNSRLLRLVYPRRSATNVLQAWVSEGRKVSVHDLRYICKQLVRLSRYKHALEVLKWMEDQERFKISAADHALRLELIIKVSTLGDAEEYFAKLPNAAAQRASYLPLLNFYVKERNTEKAECLMMKMSGLGANVTPHPYNAMMKLYMATSQFEKVLYVVNEMKQNKIPRNVLSYNLWMSACGEIYGIESVEMVYKEMVNDKHVAVGWSSLSTLANIYEKVGLLDKATLALRKAEMKLSTSNHLGYFFLITNYASLKDKEGVLRLWEACKRVEGNLTCTNYMCVLLCLVKLGDIKEAEKIFGEWESQCRRYDIRVSNVLLGAYMRNGLMEKAELLHLRTLERGGCPNYKTWEILMEGWVRDQNMEKALTAMKKGFSMLKHCAWRPSPAVILSISEYFEKSGNLEDAKQYLKLIRNFNLASLPVYKSLIKMHVAKQWPLDDILKMMEEDEIDVDDETMVLVKASKT